MVLAVATHYADRIAGTIDIVGVANFVTFLENTESYRRDLRRVEYGDERDPAMREFLTTDLAGQQRRQDQGPLFVVHGRNDPRVPYTEAEQIVAAVAQERRAGLVPAGRQRGARLRAEGERRLPVLRDDRVHPGARSVDVTRERRGPGPVQRP